MFTVGEINVRVNGNELRREAQLAGMALVERFADRVANRAKIYAPQDTGRLRNRIVPRPAFVLTATRVQCYVVADTRYAVWQHEGTGIYGPYRRRITPRRARFLRFYWKKRGAIVFYRSVRGTPATKYLIKAVRDVCTEDFWDISYYTTF